MNVKVNYEVLLSQLDWESHAFARTDADGDSRTAACGVKVLGLALVNNSEAVPSCVDCALKLGMQVDQAITKRDRETRELVDAQVTAATAAELASLMDAACRLNGRAYAKAVRDLRRESPPVRAWVRWNRITTFSLPLGAVLLVSGISEVANSAVEGWTIPSLAAGTSLLLLTVIGLARGTHRAVQVALGVQLRVQPAAAAQSDLLSDNTGEL